MENKDMPAFPQPIAECGGAIHETGDYNSCAIGLTKRELIATNIDVAKDIDDYSIGFFKELTGRDVPENAIEKYKYFAEAEAILRLIKADALLLELSKPQP